MATGIVTRLCDPVKMEYPGYNPKNLKLNKLNIKISPTRDIVIIHLKTVAMSIGVGAKVLLIVLILKNALGVILQLQDL